MQTRFISAHAQFWIFNYVSGGLFTDYVATHIKKPGAGCAISALTGEGPFMDKEL